MRLNAPRMAHETVDGEVIIIDLATGAYYSLSGSAAQIWEMAVSGISDDEITALMADHHGIERESIRPAIEGFLARLLGEELVVPGEPANAARLPDDAIAIRSDGAFRSPVVEKYTDMAELILLDPVHDVSALGWPNPDTTNEDPQSDPHGTPEKPE